MRQYSSIEALSEKVMVFGRVQGRLIGIHEAAGCFQLRLCKLMQKVFDLEFFQCYRQGHLSRTGKCYGPNTTLNNLKLFL